MSGGGRPLGWVEIETYLRDVGDALAEQALGERTVILVGGAFAAWHRIRDSTTDVDTISSIDDGRRVLDEAQRIPRTD